MGICSSCLSPDRHAHDHNDADAETDALLNGRHRGYGGIGSDGHASHAESEHGRSRGEDPEALKREREEMERICAGLANKLIDVTATQYQGAAQSGNAEQSDGAQSRVHYGRLLQATLEDHKMRRTPRGSGSLASTSRPSTMQGLEGGDGADGVQEETETTEDREQRLLELQKRWLRNIMAADTTERRWDWNSVRKIDGKLVLDLDDF